MDNPILSRFLRRLFPHAAPSIFETLGLLMGVFLLGMGSFLLFSPQSWTYADTPFYLLMIGILCIIFFFRVYQYHSESKESVRLLEWLANAPSVFQSHIQFPLNEERLLPVGQYLFGIHPAIEGWLLFLRTSFPISTKNEVPVPEAVEERISKRLLRVSPKGRASIPVDAEVQLRESLFQLQPAGWNKDFEGSRIWARSYRTEMASIGVAALCEIPLSANALRSLDAALVLFVQNLFYTESRLRESRRWGNRSDAEQIRSALNHEMGQELTMLATIMPTDQTRDILLEVIQCLNDGHVAQAQDMLAGMVPMAMQFPEAYKHVELSIMYNDMLLHVKDLAQDWLQIKAQPIPVQKFIGDIRDTLIRMFPLQRYLLNGPYQTQVFADVHLRGLLRNILYNAAQASPENGMVTIDVREESPWCFVRVEDQGPGIPEGMEERIFEPQISLESGKDDNQRLEKHMGLGLFFARMVARAYGGDIRCSNRKIGQGACFEIRLPLSVKGSS